MTIEVRGVDEAVKTIEKTVEGMTGLMGVEITGRLVDLTPVDTGFAQNSWIARFNRNDEGTPGNNQPNSTALDVAARYELGEMFYINNGAVYIGKLDQGRSDQAPQGMTPIVMAEMPDIADKAFRAAARNQGA